jgi:CubicO group peptidase (beta-lactamase class C family)
MAVVPALRRALVAVLAGAVLLIAGCAGQPGTARQAVRGPMLATGAYFPPAGEWAHRDPVLVGMKPRRLRRAVEFALANEAETPTDLRGFLEGRFGGLPHQEIIGPMKDRGPMAGMVVRYGYIVAEWGDTDRVDTTFSVTKSFLATTAGLALDRGLIRDVHDLVADYVDDSGHTSPHNAPITWHMMLRQTNEWEGTLWNKPDTADRREGSDRDLQAPGTFWEYNDVRVNRTAFSLLQAWREPLPAVLEREVMTPIGASSTWQWHGYENSWVDLDGERVQSVSGGGHWGGGMWISSRDLARFAYLHLRRGRWADRQILSENWVEQIRQPEPLNPSYGYMWWLNTDRLQWPSLPEGSFAALGGGDNVVWIDPATDLVVVVRWIARPAVDEFLARVRRSVLD